MGKEGWKRILLASSRVVAERAKSPTVSRRVDTEYTPSVETASKDGRIPYIPQTPAGWRMEPPVSVPTVKSIQGYAADATAEPELEEDGF